MTKQEYEKKYDECNNWLGNIIVCRKYIASLEAENANLRAEIAQLQADNRSLVEQMNAMAIKLNKEEKEI